MIACPLCKKKLEKLEKNYICENNHSFDISKFGHTNLLLSNHKNSKIPGDNKEMVLSRKKFLENNYYIGIAQGINKVILEFSKIKDSLNILDIGCGEGYYTQLIKQNLELENKNVNITAIDISKEAVIAGAKTYKSINWLVASANHLPITDESLDFITCMFAKIISEENFRTLKKGGHLIVVSTGENHLQELKEVVYETIKKDFYLPSSDESLNIFKHIKTVNLTYETTILENESIVNLFNMTPYRWRSPQKGINKLFKLKELLITVDVNIDIFEKE
ncbi:MAG: putative RNA methyltransferase [Fusobacteriaceae bacterium]